jgi:hypothetical protein
MERMRFASVPALRAEFDVCSAACFIKYVLWMYVVLVNRTILVESRPIERQEFDRRLGASVHGKVHDRLTEHWREFESVAR